MGNQNFWDGLEKDIFRKINGTETDKPTLQDSHEAAEVLMGLRKSLINVGFTNEEAMQVVLTLIKGVIDHVNY